MDNPSMTVLGPRPSPGAGSCQTQRPGPARPSGLAGRGCGDRQGSSKKELRSPYNKLYKSSMPGDTGL
jgi:hypothetical protein